jgi:hypothetical protein
MTHRPLLVSALLLLLPLLVTRGGEAQEITRPRIEAREQPSATAPALSLGVRAHPLLRTAATMGASAGAFAYAHSQSGAGPDDLIVAMAAGVGAGAVAGWLLSDAHPLRVALGSMVATLPAGALATFLAGVLPDEEQANIPLIAFSVPHGLLTSAFSQNSRR